LGSENAPFLSRPRKPCAEKRGEWQICHGDPDYHAAGRVKPQSNFNKPAAHIGEIKAMDLVTALAVSIGLLGGAATYLYISDFLGLGLQIWAAFIAWASFYHCGGKLQGFTSSILANLWGVVWGVLTLLAISHLDFGLPAPVWAGICVAIGVGLMVLGAKIPIFSAIPASVYGFAATVAFALLTNTVGALTEPTLANPAVVIAISMIGGAIFGLISEAVAGAIAKS
jgi:hypothetical protein